MGNNFAQPNFNFNWEGLNSGVIPNQSYGMSDNYGFNNGDMPIPADNYLNFGTNGSSLDFGTQTQSANTNFVPTAWDKLLGYTDKKTGLQNSGFGVPALNAANGLFQSWIGLNQLKLAKKAFGEQQRQFNMNWDAQKSMVNNQLETRQRHRVEANPNNAEDVAAYMAKWGIK